MKKILVLVSQGSELMEIAPFTDIFGWNNIVGCEKILVETCSLHAPRPQHGRVDYSHTRQAAHPGFPEALPPEPGGHLGWGHSLRRGTRGAHDLPPRVGPGPVPEQKGGARQWFHTPRPYGLPRAGPPPPPRRAAVAAAPSVTARRSDPAPPDHPHRAPVSPDEPLTAVRTTAVPRHSGARLPESPTDPPHRRPSGRR